MLHPLKTSVAIAALLGTVMFGVPDAAAQGKIFKAETANPGSTGHALMVVATKILKRELGTDIQINDSQTLTKSTLKLGRAQVDFVIVPTAVYRFMATGSAMYKKSLHDEAIKSAKDVRALFGFVGALFHPVTYEINTIKTWKDIKGKRVFTGPPSGGAVVTVEAMIQALTGYKPNVDYKAIHLNWGSGLQAMMDGKLDLFVRPVNPGAAMIEQLGVSKKFRLLDVGDAVDSEAFKKWLKRPGTVAGTVPAGTYKGQVNNDKDITGGAVTFFLGVNKGLPDDLAYKITKTLWANIDEIYKTSAILKTISLKHPFTGVNAKLHPGAVHFYKEKSIAVPDSLMPAG